MRMNCFDRRTLMVLSLTLSSGFSKSSAIVRPAEPALSWITLRLESFASYIHASYAGQEKESCINKIRKNYENLLNISVYPMVILFPFRCGAAATATPRIARYKKIYIETRSALETSTTRGGEDSPGKKTASFSQARSHARSGTTRSSGCG